MISLLSASTVETDHTALIGVMFSIVVWGQRPMIHCALQTCSLRQSYYKFLSLSKKWSIKQCYFRSPFKHVSQNWVIQGEQKHEATRQLPIEMFLTNHMVLILWTWWIMCQDGLVRTKQTCCFVWVRWIQRQYAGRGAMPPKSCPLQK